MVAGAPAAAPSVPHLPPPVQRPPLPPRPAKLPRPARVPVRLLAAGALVPFLATCDAPRLRTLERLLLADRFTVGRLSGQSAWHPCRVVSDSTALVPRTACAPLPEPRTGRRRELQDVGDEISAFGGTDGLRLGALERMRWPDESGAPLDAAVARLEEAHRAAPDDPAILNDLAVAYLEVGARDQALLPMLRALDAVESSVALDSLQPAALFNRALIRQRLYLVAGAGDAWARYLEVEKNPRWREEARAHAREAARMVDTLSWDPLVKAPPALIDEAIRAEIVARVRQSPQKAREFGFPLLGAWGAAVRDGDSERAARLLALAREIGAAQEALGVDRSVALAVRAIDRAGERERQALVEGHVALAEGVSLYETAREREAVLYLEDAEKLLGSGRSAMVRWASFYRAAAAVNDVDYSEGDRRLRRLSSEATPDEPALMGKTIWAIGLSQLRRGGYDTGYRQYLDAMPYIVSAREAENTGAVRTLISEALVLSGRPEEGAVEAHHALRLLSPFRRSTFNNNHLAVVSSYARAAGLRYAALAITDEQVAVSRGIDRPTTRALALTARVRENMAVGRVNAARADLEEAQRWAARIGPGRGGDRVRARVDLILGQVTRELDPRRALPILTAAVGTYTEFGADFYLPTALYEAALAAHATGDRAKAQEYVRRAIDYIEGQQRSFRKVDDRVTFYEFVENVFDLAIELELEAGLPASAFQVLERGRIHPWRAENLGTPDSLRDTPVTLDSVTASLPLGMLLVQYALLRDRVVIWTASRQGARHYTVPVPRDTVAALVDELVREAGEEHERAGGSRARLFDLLLRPLAAELKGVRALAIVPDRELSRVPFVLLRDRAAGLYVVEGLQVRTVPSATFFLASLSLPRSAVSPDSHMLAVGNPALNPDSAGPLSELRHAALEARQVAAVYRDGALLSGPDARRGHVLNLLSDLSVFHFAGHAAFDGDRPGNSFLALAPDRPEGGGILRAREIAELRLSNMDVVVLSACSSLTPRDSRTGTVAGLAHGFLRAGVPATVTTLWDVYDDAPGDLMVRFHRFLASGTEPAEALRLAQVEALRSTRPELRSPKAWAAFIYTGP